MKVHRFLPVMCLSVCALAGCVSTPGPNCVRLSATGFFCLLAPAAVPAQSGTALVTVTHADVTRRYVGQLSVNTERLTLALFSLAGLPLATMSWDGREATLHAPKQTPLDPRRLAALLELTLAAPATLRGALHGLTLSVNRNGGEERSLYAGSRLVARAVTMATGTTRISVSRVHLEIALKPLPRDVNE